MSVEPRSGTLTDYHLQRNRNILKKINLQGNEIEIFEESEESYFDKYLNEVLYLFENVNADVIVFEDMDRFNGSKIFERLREVNTLVNIQLKNESKRNLRFFYLLRDDIFISKDRTKFFDFIIPIVPVMDSSNSYEQFIAHLKKGGILERFDNNFLQGLSLYIDDMRILRNIYNEFIIYDTRLNTIELDINKMLAIITYKNIFPRDFSELQLNQGMVFAIFDKKNQFIKEEIEKLEGLSERKKSEIKFARSEHLTSIEELDDVYKYKRSRLPSDWQFQSKRQELEKKYNEEYPIRKQAIDDNMNHRMANLEDELSHIDQEIISIKNKELKDVITRENIDSIFKVTTTNEIEISTNFNDIKGNEYFNLLKFLIRNGYIDETYSDYINYFYENSLSRIDKIFLRSITDKKKKEYTFNLINPNLVARRLRLQDFDQEETQNFDLLTYLLQTPKFGNFLKRLMNQLKKTKNFKFIGEYFDIGNEIPTYIANLNIQWPEMFCCAIEVNALSNKQMHLYSIYTLYYSNDENLLTINIDDCLTNYIANNVNYLDIIKPNIDKLISGFRLLNVSFINVDYDSADIELFDAVYHHSLYKLNFENISLMLRKIYKLENSEEVHHKNYTLILTQPDSSLAEYVTDNIAKYIDVILQHCNDKISDDEDVALQILNNNEVSIDQKKLYIKLLQTPITSIINLKDKSLWCSLLDFRLAIYSEENIINYFIENQIFDMTLIGFINSRESKLDFSNIRSINGDELAEKFFDSSIECNELINSKYKEIVASLKVSFENFNIEGVSDEKIRILIDEKIVIMNPETLEYLREHYSSQILYYIQKDIKEYVEMMTNELFVFDELSELLSVDVVTEEDKIKLLRFTTKPLSILRNNYSVSVNEHILEHNCDSNDLTELFESYEKWSNSIQKSIYKLALENIGLIISNPNEVSSQLLRSIISMDDLDSIKKIELFLAMSSNMDESVCIEYLKVLGLTEYAKIFEPYKRPKIEIAPINKALLTAFKYNEWIHDFEENAGYYRIIRKSLQ
jgi:hypothetical protein